MLAQGKSKIEIELETYASMSRPGSAHLNPLLWWGAFGVRTIPLLTQIARKYLAIPATSASSERSFSAAGKIVTDSRTKLDTASVEKLVFLKTNLDKIDLARLKFVGETEEEKQAREEAASEKDKNKPGTSSSSGSRKRPASIDLFTDSD
jgi:hypothetical protein